MTRVTDIVPCICLVTVKQPHHQTHCDISTLLVTFAIVFIKYTVTILSILNAVGAGVVACFVKAGNKLFDCAHVTFDGDGTGDDEEQDAPASCPTCSRKRLIFDQRGPDRH